MICARAIPSLFSSLVWLVLLASQASVATQDGLGAVTLVIDGCNIPLYVMWI